MHIGTDSSAAKSFVGRQGLGKMKHFEGNSVVHKVLGIENPSDFGDEYLECS